MTVIYMDGRSRIKVDTDERTQVHSARSFLAVIHPRTNRGRRCLASGNVPLSHRVHAVIYKQVSLEVLLYATPWLGGTTCSV